ncbi:MAG: cytochrome P450 [Nitrososphaeraceae archaeon]
MKVYTNLANSLPINYPPGPSSRLPLKLVFDFLRDPLTVLHNLSKEYGDISHFKFGKNHIYLLNNPDYIKEVLVNYDNNFIKSRGLQLAKRILGEGLLTSEGELHRRQRQLIQPVFHPDEIPSYANIMTDYTLNISSRWYYHATIDIHTEFMHLTLAIVSKTFFNVSIEESEIKEIDQYVTTIIEHFNRARMPFAGIIEKVPLPSNMRFHHAKKHLDRMIHRIIDNHVNSDSGNNDHNKQQNGSHSHKDLISLLLQGQADSYISASENDKAVNKSNKNIHNIIYSSTNRQQLRDNVMTIFLAGHETVANALTWTFYLLSQNPREEEVLHEEVDSVLDDNDHTVPTAKDISKLEYTQRVFAESMRLYPPAWAIGRQAIEDCKIGDYIIPAGSSILMSQYLMHHDSRYFPEPERFDPERWNPQEKAKRPRFSYFPFGGGVRSCIGETFAWMEGILVIATIARRWKMRVMSGHPIVLQPLVTLRPKHGMQMRLIDRNNVGHI